MTKTARPLRLETNAYLEKPNRVGARSRKVLSLRFGEGANRERFHLRSHTGQALMFTAYNAKADAKQAELLMAGATINPKGFRTPSTKTEPGAGRRATKRKFLRECTGDVVRAQQSDKGFATAMKALNRVRAGKHPVTGETI